MKNRLRRPLGKGRDDKVCPAQRPDPDHQFKLIYSQCWALLLKL